MSDYSIANENDDLFKIQHPDGSTFNVAKNGLSPDLVAKIREMGKSVQIPKDAVDASIEESNQSSAAPAAPQASAENVPTVPTSPQLNLPSPLKDIFQEQQAGIKGLATSQAALSGEQAKLYQNFNTQMDKSIQTYNNKKQDIENQLQQNFQDVASSKIDPNRVWNNASTASKVAATVGIVLGSIGSAILGNNKNEALEIINRTIDQDIDSQKANIGKQQSLLRFNLDRYKNVQDAEAATRLQYMSTLQGQLAASAAKAGTPQALANYHIANAQLVSQMIPLSVQLAQRQAAMELSGGGGKVPGQVNIEALDPSTRERLVSTPGTPSGFALSKTKEQAKETSDVLSTLDELDKNVDKAITHAQEGFGAGAFGVGSEHYHAGEALRAQMLTSFHRLQDLKRVGTGDAAKQFEKMIPDPGQFRSGEAIKRLQMLKDAIRDKKNSEYQNHLEGYNPGQIKESAPKLGK